MSSNLTQRPVFKAYHPYVKCPFMLMWRRMNNPHMTVSQFLDPKFNEPDSEMLDMVVLVGCLCECWFLDFVTEMNLMFTAYVRSNTTPGANFVVEAVHEFNHNISMLGYLWLKRPENVTRASKTADRAYGVVSDAMKGLAKLFATYTGQFQCDIEKEMTRRLMKRIARSLEATNPSALDRLMFSSQQSNGRGRPRVYRSIKKKTAKQTNDPTRRTDGNK